MALPEAIMNGDFACARQLMKDTTYGVNEKNNDRKTALLLCAEFVQNSDDDYADIIKRLFQHPLIDINLLCKVGNVGNDDKCHWDRYGGTALHWACRVTATSTCAIEMLLSDPRCKINFKNTGGRTALFFAANYTKDKNDVHANILRILLAHPGVYVNARNKYKCTALHNACQYFMRSSIAAQMLISHPRCNVSARSVFGQIPLMFALESSQTMDDVTERLLQREDVDVNAQDNNRRSLLHYAAMRARHRQITKTPKGTELILANPRVNVNILDLRGRPAIVYAIQNVMDENDAYCSIMKQILQQPDCILNISDHEGWSVLHHACCHGVKSPIPSALIANDRRCNVNLKNDHDQTPLIMAATFAVEKEGSGMYIEIMRNLLQRKECELNLQDDKGNTALHVVCSGHIKCPDGAQMLVSDTRCNVNVKNNEGQTPIMSAIRYVFCENHAGTKGIIMRLLRHPQCQTTVTDKNGRSLLFFFLVWANNIHEYKLNSDEKEIINAILAKYDPIFAKPDEFAIVTGKNSFEVCKMLLDKGADANSASPANESAIHRAVLLNSRQKCEAIMDHDPDLKVYWEGFTPLELGIAVGSDPKILEVLGSKMSWTEIEGCIDKCSLAGESPVDCSKRLGVPLWINYFETKAALNNDGCKKEKTSAMPEGPSRSNEILKSPSNTKIRLHDPFKNALPNAELVNVIRNCNQYFIHEYPERNDVVKEIVALLKRVSDIMLASDDMAHLAFEPLLAGSSGEGTKCFHPDEVDLICKLINLKPETGWDLQSKSKLKHNVIYTIEMGECDSHRSMLCNKYKMLEKAKLAVALNKAVIRVLQQLIAEGEDLGRICLFKQPLVWRDKISLLQLVWKGELFRNMIVHVDIVPAIRVPTNHMKHRKLPLDVLCNEYYIIAKTSRHYASNRGTETEEEIKRHARFTLSYSREETAIMKALPDNVKQGYVTAKAVRRADICCPDDVQSMGLQESIKSDDYMTSYILKSCLFNLLKGRKKEQLDQAKDRYDWAEFIYQELERCLLKKRLVSRGERCLFDCTKCAVDHGCCMKRKMMLAMVQKILQWLRHNREALRSGGPETPQDNRETPRNDSETSQDDRGTPRNDSETSQDDRGTPQDDPETPQDGRETPQNDSETSQDDRGTPQDDPETPQDSRETPQNDSETSQDGRETPQNDSETSQDDPETPQDDPETPQDDPETPQNDSETSQDGRETPQNDSETSQDGRETPQNDPETPQDGRETPQDDTGTPHYDRESPKDDKQTSQTYIVYERRDDTKCPDRRNPRMEEKSTGNKEDFRNGKEMR